MKDADEVGRCPLCWSEAISRHAGGQGEGESVTEVYGRLIDDDWCHTSIERQKARERAIERTLSDPMGPGGKG